MKEHIVPKKTNFCVAYMDVAGGVPMRGVSRSGSFVKVSRLHELLVTTIRAWI